MLESILMKKKAPSDPGILLAMDFEGSALADSVKTRSFTVVTGNNVSLSRDVSKNGTQSLLQQQPLSQSGGFVSTPLDNLSFTGDFWLETWAYCLGQGNDGFTGSVNTMLSYGVFQQAGGVLRWGLNHQALCIQMPSGTSLTTVATGNIINSNNAWHHYAMGRQGATTYLFCDGTLDVTTNALTGVFGFGATLNIAGYADGRNAGAATYAGFNGYMDRLRIGNQCLHTSSFTPKTGIYPG